MGCIYSNQKVHESKIFHLDSDEDTKEKKKIYKIHKISKNLMNSYSINFQYIESKNPDSSIGENSKNYSLNSLAKYYCENENVVNQNSSLKLMESVDSSFEFFDKLVDQQNFSLKLVSYINKARTNYIVYSYKIIELAKKIKLDKKTQKFFLDYDCNNRQNKINLSKGLISFEESSEYIKKLKGKLEELKIMEELFITFDESSNQMDIREINKNSEILCKKAQGKYVIISIHVINIDSFDDPEMSLMISIIDGFKTKDFREHIFSSEVTHISISNKKLDENQRIIYYILAKRIQ